MPACNERFSVSGGVTRPKVCANLQALRPARTVVSRHPRQAAGRYGQVYGQPGEDGDAEIRK